MNAYLDLPRRRVVRTAGALAAGACLGIRASSFAAERADARLNEPRAWPQDATSPEIGLTVTADAVAHRLDRRIFGTNLEWFNQAGGFAEQPLATRLSGLAAAQGVRVLRFPGGTLSDYYTWTDGIGPVAARPARRHPTDSGRSNNAFGSPELFRLLKATNAEALLTVNAGTGSAKEAADWVAYCNRPNDARRSADGFDAPIGVKLWEVGNELYLPGNPGEQKIGTTPEVYARRFDEFARAMRSVDPTITVIGIGVARGAHIGPDTDYPDWSEVLLSRSAANLDMIAVHNAYFPMLYDVLTPPRETVYPALWAAPDAVESSLNDLSALIARHEGKRARGIGIAVTEWGSLFSVPHVDPYWTDHVKTLGSAVYLARMLQVLLAQPRVKLANHFKFSDRSFMGSVNFRGEPKLPYFAFQLFAKETGTHMVASELESVPGYDTAGIGTIAPRREVPDVTAFASRDQGTGRLYVNLVNRSLSRVHRVRLKIKGMSPKAVGELVSLSGSEPTAHLGRDLPPEWPYSSAYEPSPHAESIASLLQRKARNTRSPIVLPPFSIATFIVDGA